MIKLILIFITAITATGICESVPFSIYGNTLYNKEKNKEDLNTNLIVEYKWTFYETAAKDLAFSANGKIHTDYDIFNNEIKTNVFTTLGVDF
jgi:hypothetical protein